MGYFTFPTQTFFIEFFAFDRLFVYLVTKLMIIKLQILFISKLIEPYKYISKYKASNINQFEINISCTSITSVYSYIICQIFFF